MTDPGKEPLEGRTASQVSQPVERPQPDANAAIAPEEAARPLWSNPGTCPICEHDVLFNAWGTYLRDTYLCGRCASIPRERALMYALTTFYPHWRSLRIHESSPAERGVSAKLRAECPGYIATQYHPTVARGAQHPLDGWRCEDLENQTFANESFDLVITQDVLEHVFDPDAVAREIARTLKPGGAHLATTPMVRQAAPTIVCAERLADGTVRHIKEPEYHGNPVDGSGSLVTFYWGHDLVERLDRAAPFTTLISAVRYPALGIDGTLNEVLVSRKPAPEPDIVPETEVLPVAAIEPEPEPEGPPAASASWRPHVAGLWRRLRSAARALQPGRERR